MRVLIITSAFPAREGDPRGTFIDQLARAIAREGVEITVLAPGAPGAPTDELWHGFRVHRAQYWIDRWQGLAIGVSGIVPNLRRRPWLVVQVPFLVLSMIRAALRLARGAMVIHAHWVYPAGLAGLVAARRYGLPLVVTGLGGDLNLARRSRVLGALTRWVVCSANCCIGISRAMVDEFRRHGAQESATRVIPLGTALGSDSDDPTVLGDPALRVFAGQPGLRVIYVGSLIPRKSVITLLQAHALIEESGESICSLIVGSGPTEPELHAFTEQRRLKRVFFAGSRAPEQIRQWMRAAQVLVLPSRSEGLGLVLIEAMAEGLPVVASDIPGPRELVVPDRTGLLFAPGDGGALAKCLLRLRDPVFRGALGEEGRRFVIARRLTVAEAARQHTGLYRALVSPARAPSSSGAAS